MLPECHSKSILQTVPLGATSTCLGGATTREPAATTPSRETKSAVIKRIFLQRTKFLAQRQGSIHLQERKKEDRLLSPYCKSGLVRDVPLER